jgi:aspartate aminotransferase
MPVDSPKLYVSSSSSSSSSTPLARLRNIANHMATPVSVTSFPAEAVPQAPEDPLFGLMRAYRADESKDKVDLVGSPIPLSMPSTFAISW